MLSFTPNLDKEIAQRRLDRLLLPGPILDDGLSRRIERIATAFRSYASSYPLPLWAPGLVLDNEMRGLTEALLPLADIAVSFEQVLRRGCRFQPLLSGSYLRSSASWLDFLQRFRPQIGDANPATTLRRIAGDGMKRREFLFALMLPHHFGGGFDRYPEQSEWVRSWLLDNAERLAGSIRVLDSACGSGEGTYGVAELVREAGYDPVRSEVHGSTIEHVELFAAAHAFFPHDPERERKYRERVAHLFRVDHGPSGRGGMEPLHDESGSSGASVTAHMVEETEGVASTLNGEASLNMEFYLEDVAVESGRGRYDLVLCNGLLGGPLLHEEGELKRGVAALASRLEPSGVLLAADRFHEGWKLRVPAGRLVAMMREHGLTPLEVPEGVAGRKG